jgi:polynucleotide 5'-hydroxyl-kinase GRC3/NOL9
MAGEIDLPEDWELVAKALEAEGGMAAILGTSDSGKTTLLKYLTEKLSRGGRQVAVVDADIGQSTLGPPATISGAVLDPGAPSIEKTDPQEMFFVGSTSPSGHLLQSIAGVKKMVEWAESCRVPFTLLDTTGMTQGEMASQFKFYKLDLIRPRHLLVLQRAGELDALIRRFEDRKGIRIYRLTVSSLARSRTLQERRTYRSMRFLEYFKKGSVKLISVSKLSFINQRSPYLNRYRGGLPKYLLVGLNDTDNRTRALGIVETYDEKSQEVFIFTPLLDFTALKYIVLGSLRVDLSGRQLN